MPDVMEHYGYPFYRIPQSVPLLMVSQLIQNNKVKAVLTGEGALTPDFINPAVP